MKKYIHILSNVTYGGGEQVLYKLCTEMPNQNYLYLLRRSSQVPKICNINNNSFFKSKNVYTSLSDHIKTYFYLIWVILKIKLNSNENIKIVLHGFPFDYSLFL